MKKAIRFRRFGKLQYLSIIIPELYIHKKFTLHRTALLFTSSRMDSTKWVTAFAFCPNCLSLTLLPTQVLRNRPEGLGLIRLHLLLGYRQTLLRVRVLSQNLRLEFLSSTSLAAVKCRLLKCLHQ